MSVRPRATRKTSRPQTSASSRLKTAGKEARPRTVESEPSKVGKRGTVVIPAALRRRYGIKEGAMVIAEGREDGVLIRPAVILPVEVYTPERKAAVPRFHSGRPRRLRGRRAQFVQWVWTPPGFPTTSRRESDRIWSRAREIGPLPEDSRDRPRDHGPAQHHVEPW